MPPAPVDDQVTRDGLRGRLDRLAANPLAGDGLALLAGAGFPLTFAPFHHWWVSIVCIFTFLVCLAGVSNGRGVWRFYLFAVGMYGVGVSWIYVSIHRYGGASPALAGFLVAAFVLSFSTISLLHGWLYMRFVKGLPFAVTLGFPCLWVLQEWFRTWFLTGFPWLFAGYGFIDTPLAGYGPVLGVLGMSLVVVASASLLYVLLRGRSPRAAAPPLIAIVLLWLAGWGLSRIDYAEPAGEALTVSAVQGNVDQATKWRREMVRPILRLYLDLTSAEWGRDLIVWPEAAVTLFREQAGDFLAGLNERGEASGSTLVLGIPDRDEAGNFLNSAVALGEGSGVYRKRRLVPFGEYVPMEDLLRGLIRFFDLPMSRNRPGPEDQAPLLADGLRLSLSICYEVVYPELVRTTVGNPDLLVTISNDSWFGDSIGPAQHLQMARMRALENARYLVRATNNGVTAVVNHTGGVEDRLPRFRPGVLRSEVRLLTGTTPFALLGHWPVIVFCLGALAAIYTRSFSRHSRFG